MLNMDEINEDEKCKCTHPLNSHMKWGATFVCAYENKVLSLPIFCPCMNFTQDFASIIRSVIELNELTSSNEEVK